MSTFLQLFDVTTRLFKQTFDQGNRDEVIARVEALLDKREQLLKEIKPPYTSEEKQLGAEMVDMNRMIEQKLHELKRDIQQNLHGLKDKKSTSKRYADPYESVNVDGMFFDKRN